MSGAKNSTIYYDGACGLCRAEVGWYERQAGGQAFALVDVAQEGSALPPGLTRAQALQRFHVRTGDGSMKSGAAAFVHVWSQLPRWRWPARVAGMPGVAALLEAGYRVFLPLRPVLSRLFARLEQAEQRVQRR